MDSPSSHRRPRKFRRTGRHTTPSQVEKVAGAAGKAAPAMAIAGVLVAASPAHASTTAALHITKVSGQVHTDAAARHLDTSTRTYTVQPGDTLSGIAQRIYGNPADWTWIYDDNRSVIQNPNDIYAGEVLNIPDGSTAATYTPKHAQATVLTSAASLSGTLDCPQLEELWQAAGGSETEAFTAAEIAMAESSGNQYALSPDDDMGYWQIDEPAHPTLATYNPMGNAKAAVIISDDGVDWTPWTTYTTGAYIGQC
jgi:LysM repeat protein